MSQTSDQALVQIANDFSAYSAHLSKPDETGRWAKVGRFFAAHAFQILTLILAVMALYNLDAFLRTPNVQNDALAPVRFGPVSASSYRQNSQSTGAHPAAALLDGNLKTAWIECKGGTPVHRSDSRMKRNTCNETTGSSLLGVGESILLPLSEKTDVKAVAVANGFQVSESEFYRNPRVKGLRVDVWTSDGVNGDLEHPTFELLTRVLADERGLQSFPLDCTKKLLSEDRHCADVTQLRLTVESVYVGEDQPPFAAKNGQFVLDGDGNPVSQTASDRASNDAAMSEVRVIPTSVPAQLSEVAAKV